MQTTRKLLLSTLAALILTGCAALGRVQPPSIEVAGIRLQEIKALEIIFQVDLRVINPNSVALPINALECDLTLEGRHMAKGLALPDRPIAAFGSDIVPVRVQASTPAMLEMVQQLWRSIQQGTALQEKWRYAVQGQLRVSNAQWLALPFDRRGEIPLAELTAPLQRRLRTLPAQ